MTSDLKLAIPALRAFVVALMAAALLGSIPVAIIYSFFVEHYVAGLTAGSVKG